MPILQKNSGSVARKLKRSVAETALSSAYKAVEIHQLFITKLNGEVRGMDGESLIKQKQEQERTLDEANASVSQEEAALRNEEKRRIDAVASLDETLQAKRAAVANDPRQRAINAVMTWVPTGLWILAGVTIVPLLLKVFCYYVLAPLAFRMKPICVLPNHDAPPLPVPPHSSVSMPFEIQAGEELLLHPDFLQSSSKNAQKRTQALLNPSIPFSSIASGMWLLTRIRPSQTETTSVVVSSQKDAFGEIGCIELPPGAAIVVHPRSLAGVLKRQGTRVDITRHWRLFSVHAWLTFQLRYLVFHGPCKLVLKGCRGIRAEKPDENQPRMINQANTIGFSANLECKNTRCETFIPNAAIEELNPVAAW